MVPDSSAPYYSHPAWPINDAPAADEDVAGSGDDVWVRVAGYCAMCATTMMLWTVVIISVAADAFVLASGWPVAAAVRHYHDQIAHLPPSVRSVTWHSAVVAVAQSSLVSSSRPNTLLIILSFQDAILDASCIMKCKSSFPSAKT